MEDDSTVQNWLEKVQNSSLKSLRRKGSLQKGTTLSRNKDKISQNYDVFIFNRSGSVVVQECDHENDADRLIKVCQM